MSKARWSLKFKAGLYVGFFTIFFIITLMAAVGFGFDRYYYFMKKEAMSEASQKISTINRAVLHDIVIFKEFYDYDFSDMAKTLSVDSFDHNILNFIPVI